MDKLSFLIERGADVRAADNVSTTVSLNHGLCVREKEREKERERERWGGQGRM